MLSLKTGLTQMTEKKMAHSFVIKLLSTQKSKFSFKSIYSHIKKYLTFDKTKVNLPTKIFGSEYSIHKGII